MERRKLIKFLLLVLFWALLVIAAVISIFESDWFNLTLSILTLGLTFLPSFLEKRLKIDYPEEFEIIILAFLFASLFLGEINLFYKKFWWWDIFIHGLSAVIMGMLAFSLVYILNKEGKIKLKPSFIALFSFCFATAAGVIWEIFEFIMDRTLGVNMQKSGLMDTMGDLIIDTIGALFISLIGFFYAKGYMEFLRFFGEDFKKSNPQLFGEYDVFEDIRKF